MKPVTLIIIAAVLLVLYLALRKPAAAATRVLGSTLQTQATINTAAGALGSFLSGLNSGSHTATASYGSSSFGSTSGNDVMSPSLETDSDYLDLLG